MSEKQDKNTLSGKQKGSVGVCSDGEHQWEPVSQGDSDLCCLACSKCKQTKSMFTDVISSSAPTLPQIKLTSSKKGKQGNFRIARSY
jgi:hypothetical protein